MTKLTKEIFINKSNIIHNNFYDYSKIFYINRKIPVIITCLIHGDFLQSPGCHLSGCGCQLCGKLRKIFKLTKTKKSFIEEAITVHGDKYDYSDINYINNDIKIQIKCNSCKEFFIQTPHSHLSGIGCKNCAYENLNQCKPKTTEKFIEDSIKTHGNEYDYSNVVYLDAHTSIKIICKKHGEFKQKPYCHLNGNGCPKCRNCFSKPETEFLDYLKIPDILGETRQFRILRKKVDGYDPITNTIYEFLGDFFHGNPEVYNHKSINNANSETFGELYRKTFERLKYFISLGYKVCYIWENDWKKFKKGIDKELKLNYI